MKKQKTCKTCGFYENNCPFIRGTLKPYPNKVCGDYTYSVLKEQEQRETDGDAGKFVKILVRKELAEQIQRLGDEIHAGQSSFVGAMNQQEPPKEICSKCIHHGKDDDYCYNPHGGMQSLINENGVYECTGFCEQEQEQPEIDLEKELDKYLRGEFKQTAGGNFNNYIQVARHFYSLGYNARKEE